jgi:hypothetical protein
MRASGSDGQSFLFLQILFHEGMQYLQSGSIGKVVIVVGCMTGPSSTLTSWMSSLQAFGPSIGTKITSIVRRIPVCTLNYRCLAERQQVSELTSVVDDLNIFSTYSQVLLLREMRLQPSLWQRSSVREEWTF